MILWWSEVFGGPAEYTERLGGYHHMIAKHSDLAITPEQRLRFATLMSLAADDAGLPEDPEFRSAFMAYVEWGTRLAQHNSQPGADDPAGGAGASLGLGCGAAVRAMSLASRMVPTAAPRCWWALSTPDYLAYHDHEWGRPLHGERELFERLTLEAFQSGLSWLTILRKRENFRRAFDAFDIERVADYGEPRSSGCWATRGSSATAARSRPRSPTRGRRGSCTRRARRSTS